MSGSADLKYVARQRHVRRCRIGHEHLYPKITAAKSFVSSLSAVALVACSPRVRSTFYAKSCRLAEGTTQKDDAHCSNLGRMLCGIKTLRYSSHWPFLRSLI